MCFILSKTFFLISSFCVSGGRTKKTKPLYKKQPKVICIRAFQNGNRDNFARVTAPDLVQVKEKYLFCHFLLSQACAFWYFNLFLPPFLSFGLPWSGDWTGEQFFSVKDTHFPVGEGVLHPDLSRGVLLGSWNDYPVNDKNLKYNWNIIDCTKFHLEQFSLFVDHILTTGNDKIRLKEQQIPWIWQKNLKEKNWKWTWIFLERDPVYDTHIRPPPLGPLPP